MTLCRCVECAEKSTMRAHSARRSSGSAARTQRTIPMAPSSTAASHCSSVSCSKVPAAPGPTVLMSTLSCPPQRSSTSAKTSSTRVASPMSATTPKASRLPIRPSSSADASSTSADRPTSATRAPSSARQRAVANPMPRPPPTTTAVAFAKPRSTARPSPWSSGARPVRGALLGERRGALHRILGREDGHDELALLLPHLVFAPACRLGDDLLGHRHGQRAVGGDALGQRERTSQCLAGLGEHVDEAPRGGLLGGEAVAGQRELEGLLVR